MSGCDTPPHSLDSQAGVAYMLAQILSRPVPLSRMLTDYFVRALGRSHTCYQSVTWTQQALNAIFARRPPRPDSRVPNLAPLLPASRVIESVNFFCVLRKRHLPGAPRASGWDAQTPLAAHVSPPSQAREDPYLPPLRSEERVQGLPLSGRAYLRAVREQDRCWPIARVTLSLGQIDATDRTQL